MDTAALHAKLWDNKNMCKRIRHYQERYGANGVLSKIGTIELKGRYVT